MRERALRLFLYAALGVVVGLVVAGFDHLAEEVLLEGLLHRPLWQVAIAPGLGLALAAVILHLAGRGLSPATSEEFIAAYHDRSPRLRLVHLPARLAAGVATVGLGGSLGLEGPSIYAGSTIGSSIQTRLRRFFSSKDAKMLMVAGAAAGVAAVFKTPATGVLFALEVPYKGDVARRALLPALIASATSYLTFVSIIGTTPIFALEPENVELDGIVIERVLDVSFDVADLAAAGFLGAVAGLGALLFARLLKQAKHIADVYPLWQRVLAGGVILGALVVLSDELYDAPLSIGPTAGGEVLDWVTDPEAGLALLGALFAIRLVATMSTQAAGGVGGVFIPLAIQGLIMGRFAGDLLLRADAITLDSARTLFPAIGVAAFLGAGYRTPLASVVFVAESTGQAGFVVPALVATAVSQVMMGSRSVSSVQKDIRSGHLEQRLTMPVSNALTTEVTTVRPDLPVSAYVWEHALRHRQLHTPVVDRGRYLGIIRLHDATQRERDEWSRLTVADVMTDEVPSARLAWTLHQAIEAMEAAELELVAVTDGAGSYLGVVTHEGVLRLDEILNETEGRL